MRILFICQFFSPDITAAAFRMTDLARLLTEAGEQVRVITSNPHKAYVADVDDRSFEEAGIRVERCTIPKVVGTGTRAYLRHYLSFVSGSVRLGFRAWREGWRPDVIYVSSPPLFVGISGRLLSILFRRPMVFEVRDIWPDAAVSAGQLSDNGSAYRWGQRLERYLYRKAAHITCVAQPMRDYLTQYAKVPVTVVYNGISTELSSQPSVVVDRPAADRRTLLYAGNMGHVQQLDLLLRSVAKLASRPEMENWQIQLLGAGAQLSNLQSLARELDITDRVKFLPAVTREEAARCMAQADVLYLHLMADETMEKTIPSKLFDYLMAARPVLAGLAGEGKEILESTAANVVFPPGDQNRLEQALLKTVTNWSSLDSAAGCNKELVLEKFTRKAAADVLRSVFHSLG